MAGFINGSFDIVVSNFHLLATNALSSSQAWLCAQQKSRDLFLNPLWPNNAIWRHKSWATSIQVMACHQFGTKPLPWPMMALKMKFHWNFNKNSIIFVEEMHSKMSSANWQPFCSGVNVSFHYVILSVIYTFKAGYFSPFPPHYCVFVAVIQYPSFILFPVLSWDSL